MKKNVSAFCTALFLFCILSQPLIAQWETKGPYGGYISALASKDNNIFAGTFVNGVFRSTDDGKTWTAANAGLQSTWVRSMASNKDGVFAGTQYYGVYFSSDNGLTWVNRSNGLTSLEIENIFAAGTDLFVTTLNGVFFSSDNGLTWVKRSNGLGSITRCNTYEQMGDTVYGGTNGQGLFMTTNKGQLWVKVTSGLPSQGAVYFFSMTKKGNMIYASTSDGIYVSNDRGVNWMKAGTSFGSPLYASALAIHNGNLYAAAGHDGIFVSTDNGATFTAKSNGFPYFSGSGQYAIVEEFLSIGNTLIAAAQFGVMRTEDNGSNWNDASLGLFNTSMQDVTYNGEVTVASTDYAGIFISTDKGKNWIRANEGLPSNRVRSVVSCGKDLFAGVLFDKPYKSDDNGATWKWAANGLLGPVNFLEADNMRVLAVVDAPFVITKLFQTQNKGTSWTEIPNPEIAGGITALGLNDKKIYAGGNGVLMRTSDDGNTWTDMSDYLPMSKVTTILALDSVTYVGTENKGIFMFLKNDSYLKAANKGLTNYSISDIIMQNGVLFASTLGGGVFVSVNGGEMWFALNGGLNNLFVRKLAGTDLKIFAATRIGTYQTMDIAFNDIHVLAAVSENQLQPELKLFPNPSAGNISILSEDEIYSIVLYDVTGKSVYTRSGEITVNSIDLSAQEKGVYLLKVATEKGVVVKRVILQ